MSDGALNMKTKSLISCADAPAKVRLLFLSMIILAVSGDVQLKSMCRCWRRYIFREVFIPRAVLMMFQSMYASTASLIRRLEPLPILARWRAWSKMGLHWIVLPITMAQMQQTASAGVRACSGWDAFVKKRRHIWHWRSPSEPECRSHWLGRSIHFLTIRNILSAKLSRAFKLCRMPDLSPRLQQS